MPPRLAPYGPSPAQPMHRRHRADVDDAAVARAAIMCRATACATKNGPAQVGVEDQVPVVPGDVRGRLADVAAGVVDQDVDLARARSCATATIASMLSSSRTSSASAIARRPSASISAQVSRTCAASRLVTTTSAPARASACANVRPSPRLAPVTIAVFPVRSKRFTDGRPLSSALRPRDGAGRTRTAPRPAARRR